MKPDDLKIMAFSERFESIISRVLLLLSMIFIAYQVVLLIWNTGRTLAHRISTANMDYDPDQGRNIAVLFFNILLLIEIMHTVKIFRKSHEIKLKVILIVCLIAASRKVLELGVHSDPVAEVAIAALVLSFAISYFLVSGRTNGDNSVENPGDFKDDHPG